MQRAMEIHWEPPRGNIISTGMHRLGDLIASMSIASSGIDFNLSDGDSDFDGFLNCYEHIAGTNQYDANSTPGLNFGLIAHWTFDETNGTTLGDSSGNDVNGTLHGFENGWTAGRVGSSSI